MVSEVEPSQIAEVAVATAMVGGAFTIIILALIAVNHFQRAITLPKREQKLEALKLELRSQRLASAPVAEVPPPQGRGLIATASRGRISQIRQLDLQIRQLRIRRQNFALKGAYLLLASVVTFLIAAKCTAVLRKKLPAPQPQPDRHDRQFHDAKWARQAVTVGLIMLGGAALILAMIPEIDLTVNGGEAATFASKEEISKNWPRFRGPGGLGISTCTSIPTNWNGKTSEGILWKAKVPLPGHNSPVVWGDHVFLSGATQNKREVYCFDAISGRLLWTGAVQGAAPAGAKPLELGEATGYAAPTVVTDGRRVCTIFPTGDIACFDFSGKRLWAISLGTPDNAYGYASSLEMYRNLLLIQYDQENVEEEKSKLIALDVFSGRTAWQTKRPVPGSWSSPIVVEPAPSAGSGQALSEVEGVDGRPQVITCGNPWVIAYDPNDGTELWRAKCIAGDIVPSPIYAGGLVFAIEAYTKLVAIRPTSRGDITKSGIAWSVEDAAPDICSPVSNGQLLYLLTTDGLLLCYQVSDGKKLWEKDLQKNFFASPSIVGDKLYLLSAEGVMFISQIGPEYKALARCELGEPCYASPAFVDGRIYIRSSTNLYCIKEAKN